MLPSWPVAQWVLLAIVILAGFADQFRLVQLGPVSGLAVLTLAECGVAWCCWIGSPWSPARNGTIALLLLFTLWAWGSLLWTSAGLHDLQTLVVFALFLGLLLLSVREGYRSPQLPRMLGRALDWMSGIAAVVCLVQASWGDADVDSLTCVRSAAIVMLVGLSYQLAAWQHGQRWRLLVAVAMVAVIIASRSRMASGVAIVLFPMAVAVGAKRSLKLVQSIQVLVVGGGLIVSLVLYVPIADRILGSASLSDVRAEGVDSSGRMEMWGEIFESFQRHMWLGQGVGSTSPYTDIPGMSHPHNDYLLLAHDFGLLGMGLFLLGLGLGIARIAHHLRWAAGNSARAGAQLEPGDTLCLAAMLALVVLLLAMTTDNSLTYAFVMAPIAVLLGVSLAHSDRPQHREQERAAHARARAAYVSRSVPNEGEELAWRSGTSSWSANARHRYTARRS